MTCFVRAVSKSRFVFRRRGNWLKGAEEMERRARPDRTGFIAAPVWPDYPECVLKLFQACPFRRRVYLERILF